MKQNWIRLLSKKSYVKLPSSWKFWKKFIQNYALCLPSFNALVCCASSIKETLLSCKAVWLVSLQKTSAFLWRKHFVSAWILSRHPPMLDTILIKKFASTLGWLWYRPPSITHSGWNQLCSHWLHYHRVLACHHHPCDVLFSVLHLVDQLV